LNKTKNFGLTLPEPDDFYDIEVFNQNNRIIDALLQELAGGGSKELIRTFTASGVFRPADHGLSPGDAVDVYIAGAGGGGLVGGGGGGRCIFARNIVLSAASYNIVVGAGGIGGEVGGDGSQITGSAGGTSSAFGRSAAGGNPAPIGIGGGAGGSGGGGGGTWSQGMPHVIGGDGGTAGSSGSGANGGNGEGNVARTPINPYDGIAYGSGGGGSGIGRGGGAGGRQGGNGNGGNGDLGGGGGAGGSNGNGGNGGISGGGGGSQRVSISGFLRIGGNGGNGVVYIYARPRRTPGTAAITPLSELSIDAYRAFEQTCAETYKSIAILKGSLCIDAILFHTEADAKSFLAEGYWAEADGIRELDQGFGIGDKWDGEAWIKEPPSEEASP